MAVKNARDVVAVIDADELAAERIAVAMLEKNLFARMSAIRIEVHRRELAVERETRQRHALGGLYARNLNGRWVLDDLCRVVKCLARIPELQPAQLRGAFDRDERLRLVLDAE